MTDEDKRCSIKNNILKAANEVQQNFKNNPYLFLKECDIQAALFCSIRSRIKDTVKIPKDGSAEEYLLSLVYTEYKRLDLACLDPVIAPQVSMTQHKGYDEYLYNLPIMVGVEIKYRTRGYPINFIRLISDYEKIESINSPRYKAEGDKAKINPLVLGFVQSSADQFDSIEKVNGLWQEEKVDNISEYGSIYIVTPKNLKKYNRYT